MGQVQSEHSVQIRPQVSGLLQEVYFTEGQTVQKGQRLFRIAPAQYESALAGARAAWESAKAQVERLAPLAGKEFVTAQEYENARASEGQLKAMLRQAESNLAYTDIRAPIAGRTGSLGVKSGNLVAPNDTAALVVINQMQPVLVQYSLPQQRLQLPFARARILVLLRGHELLAREGREPFRLRLRTLPRGARAGQGRFILRGVDTEQALTFLHRLTFGEIHLLQQTAHLRPYLHAVLRLHLTHRLQCDRHGLGPGRDQLDHQQFVGTLALGLFAHGRQAAPHDERGERDDEQQNDDVAEQLAYHGAPVVCAGALSPPTACPNAARAAAQLSRACTCCTRAFASVVCALSTSSTVSSPLL